MGYPGIVYQNIDIILGTNSGDYFGYLSVIGNITSVKIGLSALGFYFPNNTFSIFRIKFQDVHMGTLACKCLGNSFTNTTGTTGNNRCFVF